MSKLLVITGPPAVGKTTLSMYLTKKINAKSDQIVTNIDADVIREMVIGDYQHYIEHKAIWFHLLLAIIDQSVKKSSYTLANGLFYNEECFIQIKKKFPFAKLIILEAPLETCLARNSQRSKNLPEKELSELYKLRRPNYLKKFKNFKDINETADKVLKWMISK
jgi:tRNA uridine 5-carbamoylmethylation protein Kti12